MCFFAHWTSSNDLDVYISIMWPLMKDQVLRDGFVHGAISLRLIAFVGDQ